MKNLNVFASLAAIAYAKNDDTAGATEAPKVDASEADAEQMLELGLVNCLSIGSISAKPRPTVDENGRAVTIDYGNNNIRVAYADQDLMTVAGEAKGFGFVETDKGESLVLHGDFKAVRHVADHNGEFDVPYVSTECILPPIAEKVLLKHIADLGLPVSIDSIDTVTTSENGIRKSSVTALSAPISFAFLVGAKASNTITGYTYTVRAIQKAQRVKSQSDMLLESALNSRRRRALPAS